jgi:hypothetical protein
MNARLLFVAALALASISACASQAPAVRDQSILEVIDQAQSAANTREQNCRGTVTYCEINSTVKRCSCRDPEEVRAWLLRSLNER